MVRVWKRPSGSTRQNHEDESSDYELVLADGSDASYYSSDFDEGRMHYATYRGQRVGMVEHCINVCRRDIQTITYMHRVPPEDERWQVFVDAHVQRMSREAVKNRMAVLRMSFAVPALISQQAGNEIQMEVRRRALAHCNGDLDEYYPDVVLSYATGSRSGLDGAGAGPGMVHVSALMHALFDKGIQSYSSLTLTSGRHWLAFKMRLAFRGRARKVVVALLTPAFYQSEACLQEVSFAAEFGIRVVPVVFERGYPGQDEQWPGASTPDQQLMVHRAQRVLSSRNTIPARGVFVDNVHHNFAEVLQQIAIVGPRV